MPYRECALYNKSVKSQIDRENQIFNRDHTRRQGTQCKLCRKGEPKKFINIFSGLDNSQMLNFEDLKRQTFHDIFGSKNRDSVSIKRTLNYANFSKQDHDIISKKEKSSVYSDFNEHVCQYETIKPPPFDIQENMKIAKRRQKATLDKQTKKHIIHNIRTCSEFARTQREKVRRSLLKRNSHMGYMTLNADESFQKNYDSFLKGEEGLTEIGQSNLRQRRLQLIRRNKLNQSTVKSQVHSLVHTSPVRAATINNEPMLTKSLEPKRPATGHPMSHIRNSRHQRTESLEQTASKSQAKDGKLVFFTRNIKSSTGTRRPLQIEHFDDFDTKQTRFKRNKNPEPVQAQLQLASKQPILKAEEDRVSMADQMRKRSLSSYCRKKKTSGEKNKSIDEKAANAYVSEDKNAQKRVANLEKFLNKKKYHKKESLGYAANYLDRLAQLNQSQEKFMAPGQYTNYRPCSYRPHC